MTQPFPRAALLVALTGAAGFAGTLWLEHTHASEAWELEVDRQVLLTVGNERHDTPWDLASWPGHAPTVVATAGLGCAFALGAGRPEAALAILVVLGLAMAATWWLKDATLRPGPANHARVDCAHVEQVLTGSGLDEDYHPIRCVGDTSGRRWTGLHPVSFPDHRTGTAFPSGHVVGASVAAGLALFVGGRAWTGRTWTPMRVGAWAAVTLTVAAGRVLVRDHWVLDSVAGVALAAAFVGLGVAADAHLSARQARRGRAPLVQRS